MTPVETLQTVYSHIRAGNWDDVDRYLTEDFVAYEPESLPFGGEWRGEQVFKRLFGAVMGTFNEPKVEPINMCGDDDWVCYSLRLSSLSNVSGQRETYRVIEHARVVDGKLAELHLHYFDTAKILRDLGETE